MTKYYCFGCDYVWRHKPDGEGTEYLFIPAEFAIDNYPAKECARCQRDLADEGAKGR